MFFGTNKAQSKQNKTKQKKTSSFLFFSSSMADIDSYSYNKQQQLVKEQNQANPIKYYTNFLYKALTVIIFLVLIPFFPSQAPEFINQTLLNRSWELLHLLFVGIALPCGIFSRINDETEKEHNNNQSNFDNVQSIMSRFLQVSSVFDDEAENLSGSDHETKVQTWSSQYYRNEPPIIVAKEQAVLDEKTTSVSRDPEKPLLLPVRSLKSRVVSNETSNSLNSKRFSSKGINGELRGLDDKNVVLPSPIPWRSRSGRMEMKEHIETRSFKSQSARFSRSNSMSCSPMKSSSPCSLPMEAQAKSSEELVRKKGFFRSPPPPPPPPPPMIQKSPSFRPVNYGKAVRFDQTSLRTERKPKPIFMEFPREEKRGIVEKLVVETTDDDSVSEGVTSVVSSIERRPNNEEASNQSNGINDGGSDVDKKADEFIAKVREQIRLQRIDSIKRSSGGQFKRNSTM